MVSRFINHVRKGLRILLNNSIPLALAIENSIAKQWLPEVECKAHWNSQEAEWFEILGHFLPDEVYSEHTRKSVSSISERQHFRVWDPTCYRESKEWNSRIPRECEIQESLSQSELHLQTETWRRNFTSSYRVSSFEAWPQEKKSQQGRVCQFDI